MTEERFQYDDCGVDTNRAQDALGLLSGSINQTLKLRDGMSFGKPAIGLGYYANVCQLPGGQGLAISTDGVGTKIIVAELAGRYDTVPIDMIAMNVNDLLCVGAEPFALVDYLAVGEIDPAVFNEIGMGLLEGAKLSNVTIPGGEIAQVKELIRGHGDSSGLDIVGTAVGLVDWDKINLGQDVKAGDVVVALGASGLHSNGFSLARSVLIDRAGLKLDDVVPELGCTLADELLKPTHIYVKPILAMRDAGLPLHALLHITGDGFCNMNRIRADVGFDLDNLPEPGAIYKLIQARGEISEAEMYSVFNMGVGFCVVTPKAAADEVMAVATSHGFTAQVIGQATAEHPNIVRLCEQGLVGGKDRLSPEA